MVSSSPPDDDSYSSPSEASSEASSEAPSKAFSEASARVRGREGLLRELQREILYWLPSGRVTDLSSIVSLISPGLKGGLVGDEVLTLGWGPEEGIHLLGRKVEGQ